MINFMKKNNVAAVIAAILLVGCGSNDMASSEKVPEWTLKIIAEDLTNNLKFENNRLGQVELATNNVDNYDLKAIPSPFPDNPFISVNFLQKGEKYITNLHSTEMSKSDEWIFTVNSNADSTVTLRWDLFAVSTSIDDTGRVIFDQKSTTDEGLIKRMQLVDAETNATLVTAYANDELQSYTFNMDGETTRTFKWELHAENVVEKVQESVAKYSALYKSESMKADVLELDKQIDISTPPRMGK